MDIFDDFEKYCDDNLGVLPQFEMLVGDVSIPRKFTSNFKLSVCNILGQKYLLLASRKKLDITPAAIQKFKNDLIQFWDSEVVFLFHGINSYNRKRLIERKISFVVPGNQMYLPMLAVDLREHFKQTYPSEKRLFSPSTQAVVLYTLYNWKKEYFVPVNLSQSLGYSAMTMTRAYNEIESAQLGAVIDRKKKRTLRYSADKGRVWEEAFCRMTSPVKKRIQAVIHAGTDLVLAGQSAMADYGMMAEPDGATFAIGEIEWKEMLNSGRAIEVFDYEPGYLDVEIWKYSPRLFGKKNVADPLSLYLSLNEEEEKSTALKKILQEFNTYIIEVMKVA